jgi:hypothetical protein
LARRSAMSRFSSGAVPSVCVWGVGWSVMDSWSC